MENSKQIIAIFITNSLSSKTFQILTKGYKDADLKSILQSFHKESNLDLSNIINKSQNITSGEQRKLTLADSLLSSHLKNTEDPDWEELLKLDFLRVKTIIDLYRRTPSNTAASQ